LAATMVGGMAVPTADPLDYLMAVTMEPKWAGRRVEH